VTRVAVGFDFDHTLGFDNGLELHAFGRLAEQLGAPIDIDQPDTSASIEALLAPFRAAEEPMEAMLSRFAATFAPSAQRLDFDAVALSVRYREICYRLVDELVQAMPGAVECIAALAALDIPIGILTNGWSELQERKIARALGDFPGPVLVSDVVGAYKPSAQAFRKLEAALGVDPSDLWYVGDSPAADIAGAGAYGLRTVWFNRGGHAYPADLAAPTAQIEHLAALAPIVRGT